ncbi:DUF460 domain-containing protein [Sulfuracidifex metallicus]|uniref:DUF460 domain-containing protein n=1 Tax=Sulfuracidifex metallicus TaxID=47303 RepID=UPI0022748A64|nr:DUF460 domain-containing protein [Sulfuracidifex metallicus]MCY0849305.1 DUF460 domain-containing protein [Sulfuracidifex metallicus]
MIVIGVDIEPNESPSKGEPHYAVVAINEKGELIEKSEFAPRSRVIRLAWEMKAEIIAIDNIYELGETDRDVINFIKFLPEYTKIVQTTFNKGEFKTIKELALEMGILDNVMKLSPLRTAYVNCMLAIRGYGKVINPVEKRTKIIVARGRNLGPGGMSQNRYKRHIRGLLLRVAREIKEKLDRNGLDYDVIIRRTRAGIEGAVFTVYSPRERLYGIVKKMRGHDVVVDIRPIYKNKIEFNETEREIKRRIIVGLDPGLEVGIAIIDIHGRPLLLESRRSIDREEIINIIMSYGVPTIIATDVNPVPDAVKKIASTLNCRLFVPDREISAEEKQQIVSIFSKKTGMRIIDAHTRDSLSAALKAFHEIENKLRQAESLINRLELDINEERVYDCVIKGEPISSCIEKEIEEVLNRENNVKVIKQVKQVAENQQPKDEINKLKLENIRLRRTISSIIIEKEMLERRIEETKLNLKKDLERDRRIYELQLQLTEKDKLINSLTQTKLKNEAEIKQLKDVILKLSRNDAIPVFDDSSSLVYIKDGKLFFLGEEIDPIIVPFFNGQVAVIEKDTLNWLRLMSKELEIENSKKIDLKGLIESYRSSRSKHSNFSF